MSKKKIPFELSQDGLILVDVSVYFNGKEEYKHISMVLDTGCTNSVLHTIEAEKLGFVKNKRSKKSLMTGAIGESIVSYRFVPLFMEALGFNKESMPLEVFDVNIGNEYAGYLGLDFFEDKKFTIDLKKQTIEIYE